LSASLYQIVPLDVGATQADGLNDGDFATVEIEFLAAHE
jgi:hypothetical protein